jgi:hypothetical protein
VAGHNELHQEIQEKALVVEINSGISTKLGQEKILHKSLGLPIGEDVITLQASKAKNIPVIHVYENSATRPNTMTFINLDKSIIPEKQHLHGPILVKNNKNLIQNYEDLGKITGIRAGSGHEVLFQKDLDFTTYGATYLLAKGSLDWVQSKGVVQFYNVEDYIQRIIALKTIPRSSALLLQNVLDLRKNLAQPDLDFAYDLYVQQSLLGVGFLETTEVCVENNNIKR